MGNMKFTITIRSCTAQCKMLLLFLKTVVIESSNFELAHLKKEDENPHSQLSGLVLLQCIIVPLGVLLVIKMLNDKWYFVVVMKTPEDKWYIVIKAYKFIVFEIWRDFLVLCPCYPSTDSMIQCSTDHSIQKSNCLHSIQQTRGSRLCVTCTSVCDQDQNRIK